ncbi:MAG: hypothetical protein QQW96_03680 [Tychonema bourrellyi B0820]|nr:hypothetical protein [Tychonema bourrellyi B0820]PJE45257.1 MAG: hypothetical protein CUR32_01255 [Flavobacterium sp.] [Flavobacterium sp. FEMGT703F]
MKLTEIKQHYQRFDVEIVTQQLGDSRPYTTEVPARTAKEAVDSTVNGGARELGRYDWTSISCGNETVKRD